MRWQFDDAGIDWSALSELYRIAPLGDKSPRDLKVCFTNSMFKCFVFDGDLPGRRRPGGCGWHRLFIHL